MASLVFQLRGRSPHNGPLVIGPRALAKALNQKGGRGRPSLLRIELAPFSPRPESCARLFRRRGNDRTALGKAQPRHAQRTGRDRRPHATLGLEKPYSKMLLALCHTTRPCFVMPARIAATDPFWQINEYVGSEADALRQEEAKRVWVSIPNPSARRAAKALTQSGRRVHHSTIARWRAQDWRPVAHSPASA
jgi:hypothetical protein